MWWSKPKKWEVVEVEPPSKDEIWARNFGALWMWGEYTQDRSMTLAPYMEVRTLLATPDWVSY